MAFKVYRLGSTLCIEAIEDTGRTSFVVETHRDALDLNDLVTYRNRHRSMTLYLLTIHDISATIYGIVIESTTRRPTCLAPYIVGICDVVNGTCCRLLHHYAEHTIFGLMLVKTLRVLWSRFTDIICDLDIDTDMENRLSEHSIELMTNSKHMMLRTRELFDDFTTLILCSNEL